MEQFTVNVDRKWLLGCVNDAVRMHPKGDRVSVLEVDGNVLTFSAASSRTKFSRSIGVDGTGSLQLCGSVAVGTDALKKALKAMGGGAVGVAVDDGNLVVSSDGASAKLPLVDYDATAGDNRFAVARGGVEFNVSAKDFRSALAYAYTAACTVEAQFEELRGVLLSYSDGALTAVGTDGRRLHTAKIPATASELGTTVWGSCDVNVGPEAVKLLLGKPHDNGIATVTIGCENEAGKVAASFMTGYGVIRTSSNWKDYPDYKRITKGPGKLAARVIDIDRVGLAAAMKDVAAKTDKKFRAVALRVHHGELVFRITSPLLDAVPDYKFPAGSGDEYYEMAVNSGFVLDAVKGLGVGIVTMKLYDAVEPVFITSGADGIVTTAVVMPVRF